jgi:hypothetical protein
MASFSIKLLFLQYFLMVIVLIFTFAIKQNGVRGWNDMQKTRVRIFNGLGGDDFNVHCKSKDDNLGYHVIHSNEYYEWKFHTNFFRSTLFFCHISWTGGELTDDFYKQKRDGRNGRDRRCRFFCDCNVTKDGVQGYKELLSNLGDWVGRKPDLFFNWTTGN